MDKVDDIVELGNVWERVYGEELNWIDTRTDITLHNDIYHDSSTYLSAMVDSTHVGVMRIVRRSIHKLPVERFVSLDGILRDGNHGVIECQRLSVLKSFRRMRSRNAPYGVWPALMKASLQYMMKYKYEYLIADCFLNTSTTPIKALLNVGFKETGLVFRDTELGDPSDSTVLILESKDLLAKLYERRAPFYNYILTQDDAIAI
ncbi:MAG TPA: acyl-homoserine-lactone synthase [Nitrospira sp.]|nr:acyl-homoserine-lactone synthase [Nitrospira sp.]